jgi:ribosomal protein S18 acetylase RimI-like enzyme
MPVAALPDPSTIRLRGGEELVVRALVPEDRELVADAFERLSDRSRYMRFLSPMPRLPQRTLTALTAVDHCDHLALVALHECRVAGIVRYVRDAGDRATADFAITVVDEWQGRGLGRALTDALRAAAAARGVRRLTMDVHPENHAMLGLAHSLGVRTGFREGLAYGVLETAAALRDAA